jgi:hypothetical protein
MAAHGPPGEGAPTAQREALVKDTAASPNPKGKGWACPPCPIPTMRGRARPPRPTLRDTWRPHRPHEVIGHARGTNLWRKDT